MRTARTSLARILGRSLILVTLIPFLPLAYLTWTGYREEVRRLEEEIQEANQQIARLAASYLESFMASARQEAYLAASSARAEMLPEGPGAVRWERVDGGGLVKASQLDPGRVGDGCGYLDAFRSWAAAPAVAVTPVRQWLPGSPPTVLVVARAHGGGGHVVGVVQPEALHGELAAWSGRSLDRHVYVIDAAGRLIFYSDVAVSRRGLDLRNNPPIRLHIEGGQGAIRFQSMVSGKERLGFVQRLTSEGWAVVVSADIGSRLLALRDRSLVIAWSTAFAMTAAVLILGLTTSRLSRPLKELRDALRAPERVAHAPLEVTSATRDITEYGELLAAFDELSGRLAATERELVQAEKASLTGQLASGIAHEIGTPLNVISGHAQVLLRKLPAGDASRATLSMIVRQSERISDIVRRFLDFSRATEARLEPVDLGGIVRQTLEMAPPPDGKVTVHIEIDPATPAVLADPKLLEHAILNLVINAMQAMPEGGRVTVTVGPAPAGATGTQEAPWVSCEVRDTGAGIGPEHLGKLFQPFFTTKAQGQGTGLGLAIVDRIIRLHGGRVTAASRPGEGATFTLFLRPASSRARLSTRD
ncbi:MAG: ATP-binding protein [Acidobacteriota bacterium]